MWRKIRQLFLRFLNFKVINVGLLLRIVAIEVIQGGKTVE
jgi:hypothetical protein